MKKKLLNLVVVFLAVVALNACKTGDNPEAIAEKYLKHVAKQEWAEAKKLGTESTQQMIDMLASFGGEGTGADVKIEDMKCTVDGETAVCTFKSNGEADKLDMVKVDGKWLVDQKKEMGGDDDFDFDFDWDEEGDEEVSFEEEVVVDEVAAE